MRIFKIIIALSFLTVLFGCAKGSSIVTGKVRPAISPSEVKIYLDPPSQYETIWIVEASSDVEFSTQAAQDRAINELKLQPQKSEPTACFSLTPETNLERWLGSILGVFFMVAQVKQKPQKGKQYS